MNIQFLDCLVSRAIVWSSHGETTTTVSTTSTSVVVAPPATAVSVIDKRNALGKFLRTDKGEM